MWKKRISILFGILYEPQQCHVDLKETWRCEAGEEVLSKI
jgi:hypothetical protein